MEAVVLHRVGLLEYFCPKQGQDFKPSAAPIYLNIGKVPLPGWRPFGEDEGSEYFPFVRKETLFIPSENSLVDRTQTFHGQLFREIKKKLWSERREDPEISIDLNVDPDVFKEGPGSVLPGTIQRGKMVYQVKSNTMLDPFLGMKWDERILNPAGDFAHLISGTIKYWMGQRNPITEVHLIAFRHTTLAFLTALSRQNIFFWKTSKLRLFIIMSCIPDRSNTLLMMAKRTD